MRLGFAAVAAMIGVFALPGAALAGRGVPAECRDVLCAGVSRDGSRVVFPFEGELTAGAGRHQVYEWDSGRVRALVPPSAEGGNDAVRFDGASADATHVFVSTSAPLSAEDTDGSGFDIYDLSGGVATLVSAGPLDALTGGSAPISFMGASPDGRRVFFDAFGPLSADDTDECPDLYERAGGQTMLVAPNPKPAPQYPLCDGVRFDGMSADGSHLFLTTGEELLPEDESGTDIYEQVGGSLTLLSAYAENQGNCVDLPEYGGASSDGSTVLFSTNMAIVPEDRDSAFDVYVRRPDGSFWLVSRGTEGGSGQCGFGGDRPVALSADGHTAIFETTARLTPADRDSSNDLYSADDDGAIELISTGLTDANADERSSVFPDWIAAVSEDTKRVAFETRQRLVAADRDTKADVYVREGGRTELLSGETPSGPASRNAELLGISGDGSAVVFATGEPLVEGDTNGERDIYARRLGAKRVVLLSAEKIAPQMSLSRLAVRLRSGDLAIRLGCPKAERDGPCHGAVKVATSRHGKPLGVGAFRIGAGKRKRIVVDLRHVLSSARHSLVVRVRGIDSLGNAALVVNRVPLGRD